MIPSDWNLLIIMLILLRTGSFVATAPPFSNRGIPLSLKVLLSVVLSLSIYFYAFSGTADPKLSDSLYLLYAIREIVMGLAMGFVVQLVFASVQIAGQLVDFQIGFSMSAVYNPMSGMNQAIMGRLYAMTALVLIFITNTHHLLLATFYKSFEIIPLGKQFPLSSGLNWIIETFSYFFAVAFQLAIPIVLVLIMTDLVMGLVSRTIPSLNVLMLGMPLKTLTGLFFSAMALPILIRNLIKVVGDMMPYLEQWISLAS
ncbi:flagellar biosynthetic protein FliR [Acidaminobacter sp.]|uniref:flagellar biosynthetic protein FliR n=1 Tax=Acidaminobacter sp. TaxID=1872102 RepID=UPI0013853E3A|nr:flagellar biosynthetic protein FliR [Acidaminobacter sp.]MDK9710571.1 flagellar biosynthetic protein FliR [Acidaminobacter sp.]MZQ96818.1 flagellar biosynthetic protein FliR [Acidaminobacter sp.]